MTNTLAYDSEELIMAVKIFKGQKPNSYDCKIFVVTEALEK